jgi:dolichol kinase
MAEFARFKSKYSANLFKKIFFSLLREGEKQNKLTGATHLFLSVTVTFFLFPKSIAVPAILILTVADSLAAIVGKLKGKHRFIAKSRAGSLTFFLVALLIVLIFLPQLGLLTLVVVAAITILEAMPLPINDNIIISLSAGLLLFAFS